MRTQGHHRWTPPGRTRWNARLSLASSNSAVRPRKPPRALSKAVASGADAVIIDLEDSVRPAERRRQSAVHSWLADGRAYVRANPAGTADFELDVQMLSLARGLVALVLPKAETARDIDDALTKIERRCRWSR